MLTAGVLLIAFLYSCVGHAGASGYIAVMTLCGLAPAEIKPAALVLNILVATIGTYQYWRAGHFSWRLFWPFALTAAPGAFLGGWLNLPAHAFKVLVGLVLLASAARFFRDPSEKTKTAPPPVPAALGAGAALGLLSGLSGTGGGIFLSPLALLMGWGTTKTVAAVSVAFILLNSVSGLAGLLRSGGEVPAFVHPLLAAAFVGGTVGSHLGSRRLPPAAIKRALALVLVIAGLKLIFA